MNTFPVPFRFVAVALLTGLLVVVGILNLRDRAILSNPWDGVSWGEISWGLRADAVEAGSPGDHAGIRQGDRLISINGMPVPSIGRYSDLTYATKAGTPVTYSVETDKGVRRLTFPFGSKAVLTARDGLRTALAFLYLGIGIFVILHRERRPYIFHFYLICLLAFVVYLFSYTTSFTTLDWWVYGLSQAAFLLLPALFVHFCLRFPVDAVAGSRWASLLYSPVLLLGMLRLLWYTGHLVNLGLPRNARSSGIIDSVELVYFCLGFIIGGSLLLKRRIQTRVFTVRQQLKWVSYGTLAGVVPFTVIYVIPALLGARESFAMDSSMLFLGLIPLSMGYALTHYRLLDVEVIARRSAAYFISSSMLLALYLFFVLVLGRALQWAVPEADFTAICFAALVIALLFAPLRNAVQARLDRRFYKDHFEDRATLLDFARTLSSEISLVPLSRSIVERVSKAFEVETAAIFLSDAAHSGFFQMAYSPDLSLQSRLYREDELSDSEKDTVLLENGGRNHLYRTGPALTRAGLHYLQDLRHQGRHVGMIALGQLPKGSHFSTEDLDLLAALAVYAAMALENANLYRSVETKAQELERLKLYTENILESVNVAVLALSFDGRITSCNRAFEELYRIDRKSIAGCRIESLLSPDVITSIQRAAGIKSWQLTSPANIFKLYLDNRVGKRLIVNLSLIPLRDPLSVSSGSLIVMDDITEKIQLEGQLMQAEKLSSIGLLAAGIAHEVNTPIAGISSYTQMLLKEMPESDRRKPILEKIEKQTFRAAEIVNGLLNFSRLSGSEFKDVDINHLIDESLALLTHQLKSNRIRVDSQYDQSLPPVFGNAGKLQQVFINLFLNARDAMPSGGDLAIHTEMTDSMVIVDISDTGMGISEDNLKRIFDPFFTTKDIGKGTGLGLAVTYGIVQEHGGRIFVDSDSEKGTHFRVKLPTRLN